MTDDALVPRTSAAVDDRTPLTASRIDVAARIGWLLRSHRSVGGLSLRQMSAALEEHGVMLSSATLSRIESEGQPSVPALDGYARVLGLPEGTLLGAVAMLCRSFPYGPQIPSPPGTRSLDRFSEAVEAVDQEAPSGAAWLEFAAHHADPAGFGLPRSEMAPRVRRLASELARSARAARFTRLEALALLRCSPYGELVEEVLRPLILEPHGQNQWDLLSTLGERPTPSLLDWCGSLLRDPTLYRAQGASYVIQSLLVLGGLDRAAWTGLLDHAQRACLEVGDDPARKAMLVQLYDALPPRLRELVHEDFRPGRERPAGPMVWTRTRRNAHYAHAESLALAVTSRAGRPDEPMLTRLLFEALFDPRGVRMANAAFLVSFSAYAPDVSRVLLERRAEGPDAASRAAALRVAAQCHPGGEVPGLDTLLASPDEGEFREALTLASRDDRPLPRAAVERGLSGDDLTARHTLHVLGMAGDRRLRRIASDRSRPESVRGGARWWLREGPAVRT